MESNHIYRWEGNRERKEVQNYAGFVQRNGH